MRKYGTHNYCNKECEIQYKHNESHELRICLFCGQEFECLKKDTTLYCSLDCHNRHQTYVNQSIDLPDGIILSEEIKWLKCQICGKLFYQNSFRSVFTRTPICSDECMQKFKSLNYKTGNSTTQLRLNKILDNMNIKYIAEKPIKRYRLDNYLGNDLALECMGTYWHVDHRKYSLNESTRVQYNRIQHDMKRHSFMIENGLYILYLWQKDIEKYPLLVSLLIKQYIESNGYLENYHSFNYEIINDKICLKEIIELPYFERNDICYA